MEYSQKYLETYIAQEERYQFTSFTRLDAKKLGELLYETSLSYAKPVAIEIRLNGLLVYCFYPEGTNAHNTLWLQAKANTVEAVQMSSLRLAAQLALSGKTLEDERLDPQKYVACGGGFPLRIRNVGVVGTICVSALPHLEDHQVIIDALRKYFGA